MNQLIHFVTNYFCLKNGIEADDEVNRLSIPFLTDIKILNIRKMDYFKKYNRSLIPQYPENLIYIDDKKIEKIKKN